MNGKYRFSGLEFWRCSISRCGCRRPISPKNRSALMGMPAGAAWSRFSGRWTAYCSSAVLLKGFSKRGRKRAGVLKQELRRSVQLAETLLEQPLAGPLLLIPAIRRRTTTTTTNHEDAPWPPPTISS